TFDTFLQATGEAEVATKRDVERIEAKIERVETTISRELSLVKWMLSILLGGVVALILKAFFSS
ncbi:MAG: integrase, partial [Terriglobia bacterium]